MKRLLLSVVVAATAIMARAEYTTMTFTTTDNQATIISASALTITFSGKILIAESADSQIALPLDLMASMHFSEGGDGELSAIDTILSDTATADVYTLDGIHAGRFTSVGEMHSQLPAGIYIIRNSKGETCKLILTK
ncbi:MAG: hypothetical protein K2F75_06655 [Paramuribaculum sp.]|nr:hypothetical protein [Paramuribaculum sp.]